MSLAIKSFLETAGPRLLCHTFRKIPRPWRSLLRPASLTGWQSKYITPRLGRDMLSIG